MTAEVQTTKNAQAVRARLWRHLARPLGSLLLIAWIALSFSRYAGGDSRLVVQSVLWTLAAVIAWWAGYSAWRASRMPGCTLCGRSNAECAQLVEGESGAVCERCIAFAMVLLDDQADKGMPCTAHALSNALLERPDMFSRHTIEALAVVLAELDENIFRRTLATALSQKALVAKALLEATAPEKRSPTDWINLSWALCACGEFDRCVGLKRVFSVEQAVDDDRDLYAQNLIWARCHSSVSPTHDELHQMLQELSLAAKRQRDPRLLSCMLGTTARCHMLLGNLERAQEDLDAASATEAGLQAGALLLQGDLFWHTGRQREALATWEKLAQSHDADREPYLSAALRDRLKERS